MAEQTFNIDNREFVKFTNKLEKLHKSALPVAIRESLNDAAFDMKKNEIQPIFQEKFTTRKANFIRSHTLARRSVNTFNIDQMASYAGVVKGRSKAGDELKYQEEGGVINNREFIPTKEARAGNSSKRLVSKKYYLQNIKPKKGVRAFNNQKFIKTAFKVGKGGFFIYDNVLLEVITLKKSNRGQLFIKIKGVYSYKQGRSIKLESRPFIEPSGIKSTRKIPTFYISQAEKRFKKHFA